MSSEEESFIILGDSPSLFEPYSLVQLSDSMLSSIHTRNSINSASLNQNNQIDKKLMTDSPPSIQNNGNDNSLCNEKKNDEKIDRVKSLSKLSSIASNKAFGKGISTQKNLINVPTCSQNQNNTPTASPPFNLKNGQIPVSNTNLAESFLLGAIDCDTMKLNVFSNFPSLCTSYTKTEDIQKLQSLIQEHGELKENLERSNIAMRQQFSLVNSWHTNVKAMKDSHENQIEEFKRINEELIKQNNDLQQKMNELQQLADKYKIEHTTALKTVEKFKFEKEIEQNKITKSDGEKIAELRENRKDEIAHLQTELSNAIAEKIAFEDSRQNYVDELDCLKVNLVATEELYKNAAAEVAVLKSQNATLKQALTSKDYELKAKQDEIDVVKVQLEVYKDDFESERKARQDLAGEKDQILSDLQLLQKRNQALIEEAQSSFHAGASERKPKPRQELEVRTDEPRCPVCSQIFSTVELVEAHVHGCLERSG